MNFHVLLTRTRISSRLLFPGLYVMKQWKDSLLVRLTCKQDDNTDNGEEEEDTNLSKVLFYQIKDEAESTVYILMTKKSYIKILTFKI